MNYSLTALRLPHSLQRIPRIAVSPHPYPFQRRWYAAPPATDKSTGSKSPFRIVPFVAIFLTGSGSYVFMVKSRVNNQESKQTATAKNARH